MKEKFSKFSFFEPNGVSIRLCTSVDLKFSLVFAISSSSMVFPMVFQ